MKIYIISTGPGDVDYLTPLAKRRIEECEVIICFKGQNLPSEALSKTLFQEKSLEAVFSRLEENANQKIGLLVTGDAGLFSLAKKVIERFGKEAVQEIIPGVSSLQVAFARIKEPWEEVKVVSFHGRKLSALREILTHPKVAILADPQNNARKILEKLIPYGLFEEKRRIFVCQDLTLPEEKIIEIRFTTDLQRLKLGRKEIVIILEAD